MKFFIEETPDVPFRLLTYLIDELSFNMDPHIKEIGLSLAVNYIDLEANKNDQIIQLSGFCSYGGWNKTSYPVPKFIKGRLFVKNQINLGYTIKIADQDWLVYLNNDGWVCIGDPEKTHEAVEFISNCVSVIENEEMVALWLKPKFLGDFSLIQKSIEERI